MSFLKIANPIAARRFFLARSGAMLSGAAVALLAGREALAATAAGAGASDVSILNTALAAELEAVAAYQLGAESGLLQKPASWRARRRASWATKRCTSRCCARRSARTRCPGRSCPECPAVEQRPFACTVDGRFPGVLP